MCLSKSPQCFIRHTRPLLGPSRLLCPLPVILPAPRWYVASPSLCSLRSPDQCSLHVCTDIYSHCMAKLSLLQDGVHCFLFCNCLSFEIALFVEIRRRVYNLLYFYYTGKGSSGSAKDGWNQRKTYRQVSGDPYKVGRKVAWLYRQLHWHVWQRWSIGKLGEVIFQNKHFSRWR